MRVWIICLVAMLMLAACGTRSSRPTHKESGGGTDEFGYLSDESLEDEGDVTDEMSIVEGDLAKPDKSSDFKSRSRGKKERPKESFAEAPPPRPRPRPKSAGVKAGSADDNLQFNAFLNFVEQHGRLGLECDVSHRIVVSVKDQAGLPLADARLTVVDGGETLLVRRTYPDGRALLFPSETKSLMSQSAVLNVSYRGKVKKIPVNAAGGHRIDVRFDLKRKEFQQIPLDIAFIMDTTGSMSDEIARLKKTLEYINFQISHLTPRPDVRFGMVLFRDQGDMYRTRKILFSGDLKQFAAELDKVQAGGGGDAPEDVQEGLREAMTGLEWRETGVKLAFLIGDAPPHLDYGQVYTYVSAMRDAAKQGIKIATIGASGLDTQGELVWRQIAQYTMAPFVFLTYGETGDSAGGTPSSVSHHVGSNWVAENLDAIIIRMVKVELAHFSPKGAAPREDYFAASVSESIPSDSVLEDLFGQSVKQLVDYCVERIDRGTPTMVLPVKVADAKLEEAAEKLETRLMLGLSRRPEFTLVERKDQAEVVKTLSEQFALKYDSKKVAELGKLVPAKLAVFSRLEVGSGGKMEMLIKLVRLETGEILSLSLLKIDGQLLVASL